MPITKEDLENITPEEKKLVNEHLKTQVLIDAAYGKGKADAEKELAGKNLTDAEKLATLEKELNSMKQDKLIEQALDGLELTPENRTKVLTLAGGDIEKAKEIAGLISNKEIKKPETNVFSGNGIKEEEDDPEKKQEPKKYEKNKDGSYEDETLNRMQKFM